MRRGVWSVGFGSALSREGGVGWWLGLWGGATGSPWAWGQDGSPAASPTREGDQRQVPTNEGWKKGCVERVRGLSWLNVQSIGFDHHLIACSIPTARRRGQQKITSHAGIGEGLY